MTQEQRVVHLNGIDVEYTDVGEGPTVVLVHGVYVNGSLWDDVVVRVRSDHRCIVPTLPLGGHRAALPAGADASPRALALLIPELLERLDLHDVTLVANDSGGGLSLIALASGHPGLARIARLVLTNCDSYEHFPPKAFRPMVRMARLAPGVVGALFGVALRPAAGQKLFLRTVAHVRLPAERRQVLLGPFAASRAVRRDAMRFTAAMSPNATIDAAPAITAFERPVVIAWGQDCGFFPPAHGQRLAAAFPHATLHPIPDARTYVMLDAPEALAELLRAG